MCVPYHSTCVNIHCVPEICHPVYYIILPWCGSWCELGVLHLCWTLRLPSLHGSPPLQKAEESQQRQEAFLEQKLAQHNKASWASTTKKQSVALCTPVLCPLHVCVYWCADVLGSFVRCTLFGSCC